MKSCVVTSGHFNGAFIKALLKSRMRRPPKVFVSRYNSSAESKARTILTERVPVALVLNTEDFHPERMEEYRRFTEYMLDAATPSREWEVIFLVPGLEQVFFQNPDMLEALDIPLPDPVQAERAKFLPGEVLMALVSQGHKRAVSDPQRWLEKRLPKLSFEAAWQWEPFVRLQRFIERHEQGGNAQLTGHP